MSDNPQIAAEILQNPTVNKIVAGGTVALGISVDWLPAWAIDPVKMGAVAGGILSVVLVVSNLIAMIQRSRIHKLEMEKMQLEIGQLKGDKDAVD